MTEIENETIAAIATPFGKGAVSIIRISGTNTLQIINKIFHSKTNRDVSAPGIYIGTVYNNENNIIDEVQLIIKRAPKSYTGEDTAEINCHGGILVTEKVLNRVLEAGARLAAPGEFSLRAVLNDKMDLIQAEAVNEIINAKTDKSLDVALSQLSGRISVYIDNISETLRKLLVNLEVSIDHPDEDIEFVNYANIKKDIIETINNIDKILSTARAGKAFNYGIKAVIIGKANVGKSSLFNALLKKDKAIVSHIEGTTRDIIEDWIDVSGIPVKLIDTAGYKEAIDMLEQMALKKTESAIETADLIIMLFDATKNISDDEINIVKKISLLNIPVIYALNKIDKKIIFNKNKIEKLIHSDIINISVSENKGLNLIEKAIKNEILGKDFTDDIIITNIRAEVSLKEAKKYLEYTLNSINENAPEEFIASDIRLALNELESIIGKFTTDDMLNSIFSNFCIGK